MYIYPVHFLLFYPWGVLKSYQIKKIIIRVSLKEEKKKKEVHEFPIKFVDWTLIGQFTQTWKNLLGKVLWKDSFNMFGSVLFNVWEISFKTFSTIELEWNMSHAAETIVLFKSLIKKY